MNGNKDEDEDEDSVSNPGQSRKGPVSPGCCCFMPFACQGNQSQTTGSSDDNWAHNLQFHSESMAMAMAGRRPGFIPC